MKKEVFEFFYGSAGVRIPYYTIEGARPWPTLVLSGWMHGDEINGIAIMRQLIHQFSTEAFEMNLTGTIIIIPVLNPTGYELTQRYVAIDGLDPNRSFGYERKKSRSHYWACALVEKFYIHADYAIDFHDAGWRSVLLPHARVHLCENDTCHYCTHEMAKYFDTEFIMERKGHKHMLAVHMYETYNKPVLTVEIGGEQTINQDGYAIAYHWVNNILSYYWMIKEEPVITHPVQINIAKRVMEWSPYAWEIYFEKSLGAYLVAWDHIGTLFNSLTWDQKNIIAKVSGHLFSLRWTNQITKGEIMYSILRDDAAE